MSEQAEQSHIRGEFKRENWEMDNYPEGEIDEMINIYIDKGFTRDEATTIIRTMTKKPEYKSYFVHHMVRQQPERKGEYVLQHVVRLRVRDRCAAEMRASVYSISGC